MKYETFPEVFIHLGPTWHQVSQNHQISNNNGFSNPNSSLIMNLHEICIGMVYYMTPIDATHFSSTWLQFGPNAKNSQKY